MLFETMPRSILGIDSIEFLLIDDGSTDTTQAVAEKLGIKHVVRVSNRNRRWLGRAFKAGADFAVLHGFDIVVNTDGDNQYPSAEIARLVAPIVEGRADVVIGDRRPGSFAEFSAFKRFLQRMGNFLLRRLTGENVPDAVSGFRAYSRKALLQLNVITNHTYTVDTLIQSYKKGLDVAWVEISPNPQTRESRLVKSPVEMARRQGMNALRLIAIYDPFRIFLAAAFVFLFPAVFFLGRFGYFYLFLHEEAAGHVQSVIVGGALLVIAVTLAVFSVIAGLLSVNRMLIEDVLQRLKRLESSDTQEAPGVRGERDQPIRRIG